MTDKTPEQNLGQNAEQTLEQTVEQSPDQTQEQNTEEISVIDEDDLLDAAITSTDRNFNIEVPNTSVLSSENSSASANTIDGADLISSLIDRSYANLHGGTVSEISFSDDDDNNDNLDVDPEKYQRNLDRVNEYITGVIAQQAHQAAILAQSRRSEQSVTQVTEAGAARLLPVVTKAQAGRPQLSVTPIKNRPSHPAVFEIRPGQSSEPQAGSSTQSEVPQTISCSSSAYNIQEITNPQEFMRSLLTSYIRVTFVLPDKTTYTIYILRTLNYEGIVRALRSQLALTKNNNKVICELRCVSPPMNLGKMPKNWTMADSNFPSSIVIRVIFIELDL